MRESYLNVKRNYNLILTFYLKITRFFAILILHETMSLKYPQENFAELAIAISAQNKIQNQLKNRKLPFSEYDVANVSNGGKPGIHSVELYPSCSGKVDAIKQYLSHNGSIDKSLYGELINTSNFEELRKILSDFNKQILNKITEVFQEFDPEKFKIKVVVKNVKIARDSEFLSRNHQTALVNSYIKPLFVAYKNKEYKKAKEIAENYINAIYSHTYMHVLKGYVLSSRIYTIGEDNREIIKSFEECVFFSLLMQKDNHFIEKYLSLSLNSVLSGMGSQHLLDHDTSNRSIAYSYFQVYVSFFSAVFKVSQSSELDAKEYLNTDLIRRVYEKYSYDKELLSYDSCLVEKLYAVCLGESQESEEILKDMNISYKEVLEGMSKKSERDDNSVSSDSVKEPCSTTSNIKEEQEKSEYILLKHKPRDIDKTISKIRKVSYESLGQRFLALEKKKYKKLFIRKMVSLIMYGIRNDIPSAISFHYKEGAMNEELIMETGINELEDFKKNFENTCEFLITFFEEVLEDYSGVILNIEDISIYTLPSENVEAVNDSSDEIEKLMALLEG